MTFSSAAFIVASLTRFTRSPRRRFRYRVLAIHSREKTTSMNRVWTWRIHATCFNSSRASRLTEGGRGRKRKRNDSSLTSRPDYLFFFLNSTKRNVFANNRGQDDGKEPGLFSARDRIAKRTFNLFFSQQHGAIIGEPLSQRRFILRQINFLLRLGRERPSGHDDRKSFSSPIGRNYEYNRKAF